MESEKLDVLTGVDIFNWQWKLVTISSGNFSFLMTCECFLMDATTHQVQLGNWANGKKARQNRNYIDCFKVCLKML